MNALKFLYAAYIATWLIHSVYIGSLISRHRKLRQELSSLQKSRRQV